MGSLAEWAALHGPPIIQRWCPGMLFYFFYKYSVYTILYSILLAAGFAGYADAYPAYPVAPPLLSACLYLILPVYFYFYS